MIALKLRDGDLYENKVSGKVFKLREDYNGMWYLRTAGNGSVTKTFSMTYEETEGMLTRYFKKVKEMSE